MKKYNIGKAFSNRGSIGKAARKVNDAVGGKGLRNYFGGTGTKSGAIKSAAAVAGMVGFGAVGLTKGLAKATGSKLTGKLISSRYTGKVVGNKTIKAAKTKKAIAKQNPYGGYQGKKARRAESAYMKERKNRKK